MNKFERQTIKECIEASKIHRMAVSHHSDCADVVDGLQITIEKLESILKPLPRPQRRQKRLFTIADLKQRR